MKINCLILIVLMTITSCQQDTQQMREMENSTKTIMKDFDWQGHRGARGLMPENTIPGFLKAVEYPIQTIELDVVISSDLQVIVSHEPWMSAQICDVSERDSLLIFHMTAEEIAKIDCGRKAHPLFPNQEKLFAHKPTLSEVVLAINAHCDKLKIPYPKFNIEIKSVPGWDDKYTPRPKEFVEIVLRVIRELKIEERTIIQSFDPRILNELFKTNSIVKTALLVFMERDMSAALSLLEQLPDIYAPNFILVSEDLVKQVHEKGMKIIPWTVNDLDVMRNLIDMGIDGMITDYPDLIEEVDYLDK